MEMKLSLVTTSSPAETPAAVPGAGKRRSNQPWIDSPLQESWQASIAVQAAAERSAARFTWRHVLVQRQQQELGCRSAPGQGHLEHSSTLWGRRSNRLAQQAASEQCARPTAGQLCSQQCPKFDKFVALCSVLATTPQSEQQRVEMVCKEHVELMCKVMWLAAPCDPLHSCSLKGQPSNQEDLSTSPKCCRTAASAPSGHED